MPERRPLPARVSIHDVMPATLADVSAILSRLAGQGIGPVTLLVVPGLEWTADGVAQLRRWQASGHELAGHGWRHKAPTIRGWRHRLHSLVLSRDVAEHLALDPDGIAALVRRCHAWFAANGLAAPELYVPPAWALGPIPRPALRDLPFRSYEVLSGVVDARAQRLDRLPMVGFEADTAWRSRAVRAWNAANLAYARRRGVPLRVAIHPHDFRLRLAADLAAVLSSLGEAAEPLASRQPEQGSGASAQRI